MTSTPYNSAHSPGIPGDHRGGRPTAPPKIIESEPGSMIAAVPELLGFTPELSIVLLGLSAHDATTDRLGPVVRTDLTTDSSSKGATALGQALYDLPGSRVAVIVVAPASNHRTGGVQDSLTAVHTALDGFSITVFSVLRVDSLRPGAAWKEIRSADSAEDWQEIRAGFLPSGFGGPSASSDQVHRELDPEDVCELDINLPPGWTGGPVVEPEFAGTDVSAVCGIVARLGRNLDGDTGESAIQRVRTRLREQLTTSNELAGQLAAACWRPHLAQVLLALAAGGHGVAVTAVLREVLVLARGSLRGRSLLLTSMAGWCGNYGVLGYRAAHRCLAEMRGRRPDIVPDAGEADRLRGDLLTSSLAEVMAEGVSDGTAARLVESMVTDGVRQITSGLYDHLLDRGELNAVKSALDLRAGT